MHVQPERENYADKSPFPLVIMQKFVWMWIHQTWIVSRVDDVNLLFRAHVRPNG